MHRGAARDRDPVRLTRIDKLNIPSDGYHHPRSHRRRGGPGSRDLNLEEAIEGLTYPLADRGVRFGRRNGVISAFPDGPLSANWLTASERNG